MYLMSHRSSTPGRIDLDTSVHLYYGGSKKNMVNVYRLNNPYASNTKMWTASSAERNNLVNAGWVQESSAAWYAFS